MTLIVTPALLRLILLFFWVLVLQAAHHRYPVFWDNGNKMESAILYLGHIGVILYWDNGNKIETTTLPVSEACHEWEYDHLGSPT